MAMNSAISLGQKVRDTVTGFVGIATCRTEWMNGCFRIGVQSPVDKDGKVPDAVYFDDMQLELVDDTPPRKNPSPETGGPRNEPKLRLE